MLPFTYCLIFLHVLLRNVEMETSEEAPGHGNINKTHLEVHQFNSNYNNCIANCISVHTEMVRCELEYKGVRQSGKLFCCVKFAWSPILVYVFSGCSGSSPQSKTSTSGWLVTLKLNLMTACEWIVGVEVGVSSWWLKMDGRKEIRAARHSG